MTFDGIYNVRSSMTQRVCVYHTTNGWLLSRTRALSERFTPGCSQSIWTEPVTVSARVGLGWFKRHLSKGA